MTLHCVAFTMALMDAARVISRLLPRLYEDEHFLFLHKPAGMPTDADPGCRGGMMLDLVRAAGLATDCRTWRLCCGLESFVSGVIGLAKSIPAADGFRSLWGRNEVATRHVAVCRGVIKSSQEKYKKRGSASAQASGVDVSVLSRCPRRSLTRIAGRKMGTRDVRTLLADMKVPVVGDTDFDFRFRGKPSGRLYLHLERVEFEHPLKKQHVVVTAQAPGGFDAVAGEEHDWTDRLQVAVAARASWLLNPDSDTFRLIDGRLDGLAGIVAEKFGDVVVLQIFQGKFDGDDALIRGFAEWVGAYLGAQAVYLKTIPRERSPKDRASLEALNDSVPLWGMPVESEIGVREHGVRYLIKPYDGYQVGLFLDHGENRRWIQSAAKGQRVLNLFAYTCAFSVAAAVGGAESTASVDISKKSLEWGKRNFAANDIPLDRHRFYCSGAFEFFKRAERQGQRFDIIVIDPPTFSRGRTSARVLQVEKDMAALIRGAIGLLDAGGTMLVSANFKGVTQGWLREQVEAARGGRRCRFPQPPPVPLGVSPHEAGTRTILVGFARN